MSALFKSAALGTAAVAGLAAIRPAPARAAFLDTYEPPTYTVGDQLSHDNPLYTPTVASNVKIDQDVNDPVDATQVIHMLGTTTTGYAIGITGFNKASPTPLTGNVLGQFDIQPTRADGTAGHQGVVLWNSADSANYSSYAAWIQFSSDPSKGIYVYYANAGTPAAKTIGNFDSTHWYHVDLLMHLKPDGTQSTYDITVTDLSTTDINGDHPIVASAPGLNCRGDPTQVDGGEFDSLAGPSDGTTPVTLEGRYDNLSLSAVPEPMTGSLLLIGGGLLALRRRRK
jgi:hypothetical protein